MADEVIWQTAVFQGTKREADGAYSITYSTTELACYAVDEETDVAVSGAYVYLAEGNAGLRVIDISNLAALEMAHYDTM